MAKIIKHPFDLETAIKIKNGELPNMRVVDGYGDEYEYDNHDITNKLEFQLTMISIVTNESFYYCLNGMYRRGKKYDWDLHIEETVEEEEKKGHDCATEIQKLCSKVLSIEPRTYCTPNGVDYSICPFCHQELEYMNAEMENIPHTPDCAYMIAKDLTTDSR